MDQTIRKNPDEISLPDLKLKIGRGIKYLKSKWLLIVLTAGICGALGLVYSILKKTIYVADCTFVLDDSKGGRLGQYSDLASLAGIDLNGSGNGIFQGDNIIELYTSRTMIEKALLTPDTSNGKKQLLIDRYINFLHLREQWKNKDKINDINFNIPASNFSRKQDSLIINITDNITKKVLSVTKPDKKVSVIDVEVSFGDEEFAKKFNDRLVSTVNEFYIATRTKKSSQSVQILQKQADSVKLVLNNSISGVASALDAAPNANPALFTLKVPSQKKQVDVQASTAVYAEIIRNLELEKIALRQETPLIQVIDSPMMPLDTHKIGRITALFAGLFIGFILSTVALTFKKIILG